MGPGGVRAMTQPLGPVSDLAYIALQQATLHTDAATLEQLRASEQEAPRESDPFGAPFWPTVDASIRRGGNRGLLESERRPTLATLAVILSLIHI